MSTRLPPPLLSDPPDTLAGSLEHNKKPHPQE